jgi:hypothetical protein
VGNKNMLPSEIENLASNESMDLHKPMLTCEMMIPYSCIWLNKLEEKLSTDVVQ